MVTSLTHEIKSWFEILPEDLCDDIFHMAHATLYSEVVKDIGDLVNHEYFEEYDISELIITARKPVNRRFSKHRLLVNYSVRQYPSRLLEVWNYTNLSFDDNSTHDMKTYLE